MAINVDFYSPLLHAKDSFMLHRKVRTRFQVSLLSIYKYRYRPVVKMVDEMATHDWSTFHFSRPLFLLSPPSPLHIMMMVLNRSATFYLDACLKKGLLVPSMRFVCI